VPAFAGLTRALVARKPLQPALACHRLCPDLPLGLPKLGCKADSSFLITNHFPSICCPEMRSRYHPAFGGTASRADVRMCSCDRQAGQRSPASSPDTSQQGLLLPFGWRAGLESLTHQQALGFAGNLSLPCHKALLNLPPPKPTSRFQKPELQVEIPCSVLTIASPAGTCGKGKKSHMAFWTHVSLRSLASEGRSQQPGK